MSERFRIVQGQKDPPNLTCAFAEHWLWRHLAFLGLYFASFFNNVFGCFFLRDRSVREYQVLNIPATIRQKIEVISNWKTLPISGIRFLFLWFSMMRWDRTWLTCLDLSPNGLAITNLVCLICLEVSDDHTSLVVGLSSLRVYNESG